MSNLLRSLMMILMMGWMASAWGQTEVEKEIYSTDFTDWSKEINRKKATEEVVNLQTKFGENFTFTFTGVGIYPSGTEKDKKFPDVGFMETAKYTGEYKTSEPNAIISSLSSVTRISLHQAATGTGRGIKVSVKGDGDTDWVVLHDKSIGTAAGEDLNLTVNRTNCQIKFENYSEGLNNNAYVTYLAIYGYVKEKTEVKVNYYQPDGTLLGTETAPKGSSLAFKYGEKDITITSGSAFRGWFDGMGMTATKVTEGTELTTDLNLYAKVTPIEQATYGSSYSYDLTKKYFYQEDHELIDITGGEWKDASHGWYFENGGTIKLQVARGASIDIPLCNNNSEGMINVYDGNNLLTRFENKSESGKEETYTVRYNGGTPTTLTFNIPEGTYIHSLDVRNIKLVIVSFDFKNNKLEGDVPSSILCDENGEAKLPFNGLFYRDGWTFDGWTDGTNDYEAGKTYSFNEDVTLRPKMVQNTLDITDTNKEMTVRWPFDHTEAPEINMQKGSGSKSYTQSGIIYINDKKQEKQDVKMIMDASDKSAKIDNHDSRINGLPGKGAQVNKNTVFTLPAVYGMKVTVHASAKVDTDNDNTEAYFNKDANDAQITVTDDNSYTVPTGNITYGEDHKSITFIYKGDATTLHIKLVKAGSTKDWGFYEDITAIYPVLPNVTSENIISNQDFADPTKYPNEKVVNAGFTTISSSATHANTGKRYLVGDVVTLSAKEAYGYDFKGFRVKGSSDTDPSTEKTSNTDNFLSSTSDADGKYSCSYTITENDVTTFNGIIPIEVVYERKTLYKVIAKSADTKLGNVSISPIYENFYQEKKTTNADGTSSTLQQVECWYTEGSAVTVGSDAATDYTIDYWAKGNSSTAESKDNTYTFTIAKDQAETTWVAHFKQGYAGTVIFDISEDSGVHVSSSKDGVFQGAGSMQPTTLKGVRSFVIPTNYTIFKSINDDGTDNEKYYTLQYWTPRDNTDQLYEPGKQYSFSNENQTLTLVPVFTQNPTTQVNRVNNPVIRYDFGRKIRDYADPTANVTRKVCAQTVNIGKNQKVFWTSKVYVNILEGGERHDHWRDVAMWCNTGEKGYIRNEDFDDWCAFGPGTTFWVTAGTGAKISILSYSPITTTTIDGTVPSLDQVRTDSVRKASGSNHMYVYSHTTAHSSERLPIIIGDDYTYYQWIELSTLAANWVDFHAEVDDEARGVIDKTTTAIAGNTIKEKEDGDYSFHMGERVKITFHRKKGYELSQIVGLKKHDAEGNPLPLLKMNEDGTVDMLNYDFSTYTKCQKNADGSWGVASGEGKTMWVLKATDETTHADASSEADKNAYYAEDSIRTKYELEFDITAHRSFQLQFAEKSTYYITYNSGKFAMGTPPEAQWVEAGDQFTIPRNQTLYYEGHTLDHWEDEDRTMYARNNNKRQIQRHTAPASNLRMFPIFEVNNFNLLDLEEDATATWNFIKDDEAPTINYQKTKGILVTQLTIDSDRFPESIDLKIDLDGTDGKFDNTNTTRTDRIQTNAGSIILFPSTPQCQATLKGTESDKNIEIAGTKVSFTANTNSEYLASASCSGESAYQNLNFVDGTYCKSFSVTYKPQTATQPELESLSYDGKTLSKDELKNLWDNVDQCYKIKGITPWTNLDKSGNEQMPTITGTATQEGTVVATQPTLLNPECAITIKNKAGITIATKKVVFEFATPEDSPKFEQITVNGKTYTTTSNEIQDVPKNGLIKVKFNRTMKAIHIPYDGIKYTSEAGRELEFKYWDMKPGSTINFTFKHEDKVFQDIYGKTCEQDLTLILHIAKDENSYHHQKFDFIVGEDGDGDINEAILAANGTATGKTYNNTKTDGSRYYIFVPDGEYQLLGNGIITFPANGVPKDETGIPRTDMNGKNNGVTDVIKPSISLIGQSKEGVTLWNHPVVEGISYTATLNIENTALDFYAQDLNLENRFDYWSSMDGQGSGGAGRAAAFADNGNRTTLKNVGMWSYQDTYYSKNGADGYRGYMEDCDLAGVVDWICGSGDIWFEKCNLILRDRTGNNIVAPHTEVGQEWGYVFNNCTIKPETSNPIRFKGKDWTLGRPWGSSPACTFLNTTMYTQPRNYGWGRMNTNLPLRFHEYNSVDEKGNTISLSTRSLAACTPAAGSDDCVLTDPSNYTVRNVLGGIDSYEPNKLCTQIDAKSGIKITTDDAEAASKVDTENHIVWEDNISIDDDNLQWDARQEALCYFLFKLNEKTNKWIYQANTADNSINLTPYGSGYYCVRAANQRGGLGSPTSAMQFVITDPYTLEIKQVGSKEGYGWSTICMPFNAKVPEGIKVYAATPHVNDSKASEKVEDFLLTLTEMKEVIDSMKGYVVYGPVGKYTFKATSRTDDTETILTGNPSDDAISSTNINCYVLANKSWGLGFYKFTGATLAAHRAWLPSEMVSDYVAEALASGRRAIRFVFADGTTAIRLPVYPGDSNEDASDDALYNLSGQQVDRPTQPGIYISRSKGKVLKK